jgi:hypothetical protein
MKTNERSKTFPRLQPNDRMWRQRPAASIDRVQPGERLFRQREPGRSEVLMQVVER